MSSDAVLYLHNRRLIAAEAELFGSSAEQARVFRAPGIVGAVNPHAPDRSIFNWCIAESTSLLLAGYSALADAYVQAGVRAWTVWLDPGDEYGARELGARGHLLDAQPLAMGAEIGALGLPEAGDLDARETRDATIIATLNEAAYTFPPPAFRAAFERICDPRWHAHVAFDGDRPVACVMIYDSEDGDAGVSCVATLPEVRGRAFASRLLGSALRAAVKRGCGTTSLQATSKGAPVYARLGYRNLGAMSMWEHRVRAPSPV
ncbi:MAG: GNAT family N-acetyltransferase [Myxococcota bacterium]